MSDRFKALKITRQFIDALNEKGISEPTDIQDKAIPPALAGQDVLGVARTGSGKTLAYLIPVAMRTKFAQGSHPRALVLLPSKELAVQVHRHAQALTTHTDLRSVVLYGGVGRKNQIEELQNGCDILISTPGRFSDLYALGHIHTRGLKMLVLDEADRMMDMGFMPQLRKILDVIPVKRQNLLFSATFPERVEKFAAEFLEFPIRVFGQKPERPVDDVRQSWYPAPNFRSKLNLLIELLKDPAMNKVMVFCRTKDTAERVSRYLARRGVGEVRVLHANKGQNTRLNAMDSFEEGQVRLLVTTDVSARGIDVEHVSHVVNFDVPVGSEDYLHRIGRTARIEREGEAISFATEIEEAAISQIASSMETEIERLPWPEHLEYGEDLPGEKLQRARDKDQIRKAKNPKYGGAFHAKKKLGKKKNTRSGKRRKQ